MFKCQLCRYQSKENEPSFIKILNTREKVYPAREKAFKVVREGKTIWFDDKGGIGQEITREIQVCSKCN